MQCISLMILNFNKYICDKIIRYCHINAIPMPQFGIAATFEEYCQKVRNCEAEFFTAKLQ